MRIKSIVAVLLATSVILLGEPLMVNASSTPNIVVNELAEAQEADTVNTVELPEVIEISDDSISEEELQSIYVPNDEDVSAEAFLVDEELEKDETSVDEEIFTEQIPIEENEDELIMEDSASIEDSSADDLKVPKNKSDIKTMSESEEDVNDIGTGLTFTINKGTLTISGSGEMRDWQDSYYADVKAPWLHKDVTNVIINAGVKSIGDAAFENCSSIKSIVCKGDINKIGFGAFTGCTSLEKLEFDGIVKFKAYTHIGDCTKLNTLIFKKEALFNDEAIMNLPGLKTLTFPVGSTFGKKCFYGCEGLTNVTFLGSVDLSAGDCFAYCPNLKTIAFNATGSTQSKIANNAFFYSNSISSITFKSAAEIGDAMFLNLPNLKTLTFPAGSTFGVGAFGGCSGVTSISFMGNVDLSAGNCFAGCPNLKTLSFNGRGPEESIVSNNAFLGGFNIVSLIFKGPVRIGEQEFMRIRGVKSLTFGGDANIGSGSFSICENLTKVTFNGNADLDPACFLECGNTKFTKLEFKKGAIIRADSSGSYAFKDSPITTIKFAGESLLAAGAFKDYDSLKTVTFSREADLGDFALSECDNLTSVKCAGPTELAANVLSGCPNLKTLSFVKEVNTYNDGACCNLPLLTSVSFGSNTRLAAASFLNCPKVKKVEFKKLANVSTDSSNNYAFKDSPLESITFGGNASLGDKALYSCINLTNVKFKGDANLGQDVLSNCSQLKSISFGGKLSPIDNRADITGFCSNLPALTTVTFAGEAELPYGSFNNCNNSKLNKLTFGKSVTVNTYSSGSVHAFCDSAINTITFGGPAVLKYGAFQNNNSIKTLTFKGDASLGEAVFGKCSALTSVSFKGKAGASYNLGVNALRDCQNLKSIYFGSGTLSVYGGACSKLPSLTSITFGGDTTLLGESFIQCDNAKLTKLTFKGNTSIRPSSDKYPFADSPISTLSIAGNADLRNNTFNDSYLTSISLGGSGKKVEMTEALLNCGLLRTVNLTGTIKVTDSLNNCPELTTATIKYDVKKGESCSFIGNYFKSGCPSKIIVNGKTVQYADL